MSTLNERANAVVVLPRHEQQQAISSSGGLSMTKNYGRASAWSSDHEEVLAFAAVLRKLCYKAARKLELTQAEHIPVQSCVRKLRY